MKHHYWQYRFRLLKQACGDRPLSSFDPLVFRRFVSGNIQSFFDGHGLQATKDDTENVILFAETEFRVHEGEGEHIFVGAEAEAVIERAVKNISDADLIKYRPDALFGVVYMPNKPPSLFVSRGENGSLGICVESLGILRIDGMLANGWMCATDANHLALTERMRMVCGVFMMRESFPEMFVSGPPQDLRHPAWYRKLRTSHVSLGHIRKDMAPHIRRGHFRLLSSDKFTKKRGQLVFVRASMVKGEAVHTENGGKK